MTWRKLLSKTDVIPYDRTQHKTEPRVSPSINTCWFGQHNQVLDLRVLPRTDSEFDLLTSKGQAEHLDSPSFLATSLSLESQHKILNIYNTDFKIQCLWFLNNA